MQDLANHGARSFLFVFQYGNDMILIHETLHEVMKSADPGWLTRRVPADTLPIIIGFASHISSLPRQRLFVHHGASIFSIWPPLWTL